MTISRLLYSAVMIQVSLLCCSMGQVSVVDKPVHVNRGGSVDLKQAINIKLPTTASCRVQNIARTGSSCGMVSPEIFDCRSYTGSIVYQHFGCFSSQELATFMISTTQLSNSTDPRYVMPVQASIFAVEITVDEHPFIEEIKTEVSLVPSASNPQDGSINLTLVFPSFIVSFSSYEVITSNRVLSLPMAGKLEGSSINQHFPTGFISTVPLVYHPFTTTQHHSYTDYVLIRIYYHALSSGNIYIILPFVWTPPLQMPPQSLHEDVLQLKQDVLVIHQAVDTSVLISHFNPFNSSTQDLPSDGIQDISRSTLVRYTFPVLDSGSFHSLYTTNSTNVSYSVFTSNDLLAGHVSFHPNNTFSSTDPFIYRYNVTNMVGVTVATGEVSVLVRERIWAWPTQRRNIPLAVAEGGMAVINQSTIDFYLLNDCLSRASMYVLRPPSHGELVYENMSRVGADKILLWVMRNTSLLRYKHSGDEELGDLILWEVQCPFGEAVQVVMSVLVAAVDDDTSPKIFIRAKLQMYQGWALPLSSSLFTVVDPDSPQAVVQFKVNQPHTGSGTLLKTWGNVAELNYFNILFPFVSIKSLIPSLPTQFYEVVEFSLEDLENQKIWYVPMEKAEQDSIELTVTDSINQGVEIYTLYIQISSQSPNETLLISTHTWFPDIIKNIPLPLSNEGHVYLTPYFLYSQTHSISAEKVWYVIQSSPQHGRLCLSSECSTSIGTFTQYDIEHRRLQYYANGDSLKSDHIVFMLTLQGVPHINPQIHLFNWTTPQKENVIVSNKQFWLNLGNEKVIAPRFFRIFSSQLRTRNIIFQVLEHPQHGNLILRNETHLISVRPSSFTFDDLLGRHLWYDHTQANTFICNDQLSFSALSTHGSVDGYLPILFRNKTDDLKVSIQSHTLRGPMSFTFSDKDFVIYSSFCLEFVTFTLHKPPGRGKLNLVDRVHKTERELVKGSRFTAKDVHSGALTYSLSQDSVMDNDNVSDEFILSASDPISEWPTISDRKSGEHFIVIIVPSPNVEYVLDVRFTSEHPLTWLPYYQSYGYALTPSDIDLMNSTLQPYEVVIQLDEGPMHGYFILQDSPASIFTVHDVSTRGVVYITRSFILDKVFRDRVELGVHAYLPGFSHKALSHQFYLEWAVVEFEEKHVIVMEYQDQVHITIRRKGVTRFESRVLVTTIPDSASFESNCSTQSLVHGDFCTRTQEVVFPVGVVSQEVSIQLLDDSKAEGPETFYVQLLEGEGLTNAILRGNISSRVTIIDTEDYSTVGFLRKPSGTLVCELEVTVEEGSGRITINLTRSGNLEHEVGVVCSTEDDSARGNADYIPRFPTVAGSEVKFGINQSKAECPVTVIDDEEYEPRERFYVHLTTSRNYSLVHINSELSTLCVHISYDDKDGPIVTFNESEVFVQESESRKKYARFTLDRRGPDLNFITMVKYNLLLRDGDNATENLDFKLFVDDTCTLVGDDSPGGCVSFAPGQTKAILGVEILPDTLLEGNEVFHIRIVYVRDGKRSPDLRYSILRVVIIDGAQPMYVDIVSLVSSVRETSGSNRLELRRHGFLQLTTQVKCVLKGGTAVGSFDNKSDFIVAPIPEVVEFAPNQTTAFCSFFILDDGIYEDREDFIVKLEVVDGQTAVILSTNTSMATVYIIDPEDIPVVEFNVSLLSASLTRGHDHVIEVEEPLTNSLLDSSNLTLCLQRSGDISKLSTIRFFTIQRTALDWYDFIPTSDVITFKNGVTNAEISIQILSNHERIEDSEFMVALSPSRGTNIGNNSVVRVTIKNYDIQGPYFPDLPQLDNVENGVRTHTEGRYFDLPLICITPCDVEFDHTIGSELETACQQQKINYNFTLYSWEISTERDSQFKTLNYSSIFTSCKERELQTVYLQPNIFIRCQVTAMDGNKNRGHSRTSDPVQLTSQWYNCHDGGVDTGGGTISSYEGFMAHDEDVVKLEFSLPAVMNRIPLLSMSPFSLDNILQLLDSDTITNSTRSISQSCSNFNMVDGNSLLGYTLEKAKRNMQFHFDSIYIHLNRSKCRWEFSAWYPIKTLLHTCQGEKLTRTGGRGDSAVISISAYSYGVHFGEGLHRASASKNMTIIMKRNIPSFTSFKFLPPPIHILSESNHQHHRPYIFPLSIVINDDDDEVRVFLHSVAPTNHLFFPNGSSEHDIELLYVNRTTNTQVWLLYLSKNLYYPTLELTSSTSIWWCDGCKEYYYVYKFHLPVEIPQAGLTPTIFLDANAALLTDKLIIGGNVSVNVELSSQLDLQDNLTLQVQELLLCEQDGGDNCSSSFTILDISNSKRNSRINVHVKIIQPSKLSFTFSTNAIILVNSPSQWFLHIQVGLSSSSSSSMLHYRTMLPFTLRSPITNIPPSSSPIVDTMAIVPVSVYAMFGVLTVFIVLLLMCMGIVAIIVCASRGKANFNAKTAKLRGDDPATTKEKLNISTKSKLSSGVRYHVDPYSDIRRPNSDIRRPNSTIGFPTHEKKVRKTTDRTKKGGIDESRGTPVTSSLVNSIHRSRSLPSLSACTTDKLSTSTLPHFHDPGLTRRINRVYIQVKKLNMDHLGLDYWAKEQLKGNKAFRNLRIVQDLAMRQKNYGVNEIRERGTGSGCGPYASYMVRTLAASAVTPEPGAKPVTLL